LLQDSVREHELAVMAAAFSDHAYARPSATTDGAMFSPRKSARIKQRMDDGKNAFGSDSDFEYYLTLKQTWLAFGQSQCVSANCLSVT